MNFVHKKFQLYYQSNPVKLPYRFERREYAFILFGEHTMRRHLCFSSKGTLESYFKKNVPSHAYYSTAYYRTPSAGTMKEKQWMGADLIFDLDADHLPHATHLPYESMLQEVKKELVKLLVFLTDDFGFSKDELMVNFSGGRGYHCHVRNKYILGLSTQERREIIDYITGRGFDFDSIPMTIDPEQVGWTRRLLKGLVAYYKELSTMERKDVIDRLMKIENIGKKTAEGIHDQLTDEKISRIAAGQLNQSKEFKKVVKPLLQQLAVSLHGEADEPVTTDVKRLIRMPGSLHGKTGLAVTEINIDSLVSFDPLTDAVVLGEEPIALSLIEPVDITMKEQRFKLEKGTAVVPEYLAVFLVARGVAAIV